MAHHVIDPNLAVRQTFPPEIWDNIIDDLKNDLHTLKAVSLSHRSFLPRCRFHKFDSVLVASSVEAQRLLDIISRAPSIGKLINDLAFEFSFASRVPSDAGEEAAVGTVEIEHTGLYSVDPALLAEDYVAKIMKSVAPEVLTIISNVADSLVDGLRPAYQVPNWRTISRRNRMAINKLLRECTSLTNFRVLGAWKMPYLDLWYIVEETSYQTSRVDNVDLYLSAFDVESLWEALSEEEELLEDKEKEAYPPKSGYSSIESVDVKVLSMQPQDHPEDFLRWLGFAQEADLEGLSITLLAFTAVHIQELNRQLSQTYYNLSSLELVSSSAHLLLNPMTSLTEPWNIAIATLSGIPLNLNTLDEFRLKLVLAPEMDTAAVIMGTEPFEEWAELLTNSVRSRKVIEDGIHFYLTLQFYLGKCMDAAPLNTLRDSKALWVALDEILADPTSSTYWHVEVVFSDDRDLDFKRLGFETRDGLQQNMIETVREILPRMGSKIEVDPDEMKEGLTMKVRYEEIYGSYFS